MSKRLCAIVMVCMCVISCGASFTEKGGVSPVRADEGGVEVNTTDFPDKNFRKATLTALGIADASGKTEEDDDAFTATIPAATIQSIKSINIGAGFLFFMNEEEKGSFLENEDLAACIKAIKSLKGIEKFTALEAIDLDNGMPLLESLDVSGLADSLTRLQAAGLLKLNTLILGNNAILQALHCYDDPLLCELDISGCTKLLNKEEGVEFEHNTALNIITDEETRYAPKFYGKSLMLSGNLGLYFYVKLPVPEGSTFDELYDGSYMTFAITEGTQKTKDFGKTAFDKTETITITEYGKEVTLYGFRCGVNSAQIADKIAALFHYGTPDAENNNQMKYITLHAEEGEAEGTVTVSEYLDALTAKDICPHS